ncbi:2-octaprenylphenol hydroxylase [Christensenellaceae bacterium OttesenSCG-928-K19]|nr:2-octaprenylphenol hydroxylase [Christensenellaceae bacterium OttesenSCG-928-K19]
MNLKRFREIMSVLGRNGLGFIFVKTAITRNPQKQLNQQTKDGTPSIPERIRISCEQLGPTFVKLGQILSTRTDIIPASVSRELQKLQDHVSPFSFDLARELIETELQDTIENIFLDFDKKPAASASVSQVYSARLHSGDHVAVKVQRPGVLSLIETDLAILQKLARFVDKHTKYGKLYDFEGMVNELKRVMQQEMDFVHEGENIDRFRTNLSGQQRVSAPKVRWIYTTSKILTMDYVDGIKISDIASLNAVGANKPQIARDFIDSMIHQILIDGFFHADPHPGNVMITHSGTQIEFIDLGMAGQLGGRFREQLSDMILGLATQNVRKVGQTIMDMDLANANVNQRQFYKTLGGLLDEYLYKPVGGVNVAQVFYSVFMLASEYKMKVPAEFTLVAKALGTMQGIIEDLDPKTSILDVARDTLAKLETSTLRSKRFKDGLHSGVTDLVDLAKSVPAFFLNLMRKSEENDFAVEMRVKDLDKLEQSMERMVNRISFTIILLAVCIVMAGVIIAIGYQAGALESPMLYELSLFALRAGLIIAVLIILGLLFNIIYTNVKKP